MTIEGHTFCLDFALAGVHFQNKIKYVGHVGEQKIKSWPIITQKISGIRLLDNCMDHV